MTMVPELQEITIHLGKEMINTKTNKHNGLFQGIIDEIPMGVEILTSSQVRSHWDLLVGRSLKRYHWCLTLEHHQ